MGTAGRGHGHTQATSPGADRQKQAQPKVSLIYMVYSSPAPVAPLPASPSLSWGGWVSKNREGKKGEALIGSGSLVALSPPPRGGGQRKKKGDTKQVQILRKPHDEGQEEHTPKKQDGGTGQAHPALARHVSQDSVE